MKVTEDGVVRERRSFDQFFPFKKAHRKIDLEFTTFILRAVSRFSFVFLPRE